MSKKKDEVTIRVIGGNAEDVTGSASIISYSGQVILFEFGMIQRGKSIYENYSFNKELVEKIRPKKIDYIFIGHCHCDHIGLIPALYKKNCTAKIIAPQGSYDIMKAMWLDSAYINQRDAEILSQQKDKTFTPLFDAEDAILALEYVEEYSFNTIHSLDERVTFRFIPAGHILFSAQTELFFSQANHSKKVLFTSDLGNIQLSHSKIFVEKFQPIINANIVIGEATYGTPVKKNLHKLLKQDTEKIKVAIDQYCIDNKSRILIPCFALDRLPYMLWILYSLYGENEEFKIPIYVDSPLGIRLIKAYQKNLPEEMLEDFCSMISWKQIKFIEEPDDSRAAIADGSSKIVLASAGMLTAGRSVKWTQSVLPRSNDCILFIGYAATNTLAYKIKHAIESPYITIAGKELPNRCQIIDLRSFSSHMQYEDLINYYSSINAEKIYIVHSNMESKLLFKEELQKKLEKDNKSTKVIAVNRSTTIKI